MQDQPSYSFTYHATGRSGTIMCVCADQSIDIDWEMSGAPEYDILLAPVDLRTWRSGHSIEREQQRQILQALRRWLLAQRMRADIAAIENPVTSATKCVWSGCQDAALIRSVYCLRHYDEMLLR